MQQQFDVEGEVPIKQKKGLLAGAIMLALVAIVCSAILLAIVLGLIPVYIAANSKSI